MKTKLIGLIFFLSTVVIGNLINTINSATPQSKSRTITVPNDCEKIQNAINLANNGDIIHVKAGIYNEEWIKIDKSVSLIGENKKSTIYYHSGLGFIIEANYVNISGFTITNFEPMKGYAVSLANVSNCIIENNLIENNIVGIYLYGYSSNNTISKNILEGNKRSIELINSFDNEITENSINGALVSGISLDACSGNVVSMNTISDLEDGNGALMLWISSDNTIYRNILFGGNLFLMINCSNNILTENFVIDSHYGVFIGNSSNNTFYSNYFINVTQQVLDNEIPYGSLSKNSWDNGIEGNYWTNYYGEDANHDGIGDSVQLLYENNLDKYPLITYPEITTKPEKNGEPQDSTSTGSEFPPEFTYTILVSPIIIAGIIIAMKKRKNKHN